MSQEERLTPADWQQGPRYGGPYTFLRAPASRNLEMADVAIIGLPFDTGSVHRPGARYGPRAIRNASGFLVPHPYEPGDPLRPPFQSLRIVDYGDLPLDPNYIAYALDQVTETLTTVFARGVLPVCLGGDHSLTLGILRACHRHHQQPLSLLLIDAHPEYWQPRDPERPYNHGSWLLLAVGEGLVDPRRCVVVGVRGSNSLAILDQVRQTGITVITADEVAQQGVEEALARVRGVIQEPLYVSLDMDSVDPAFAPAVAVPEVGGLTSREALALARGLVDTPVVGFDVMEVTPLYDQGEITAILAANLVYEFLLTRAPA